MPDSTTEAAPAARPDLAGRVDGWRIDLGCGAPHQKYAGCIGIDANPQYTPDILLDADHGLPFADNTLDFINSDNSLEHFRNPHFILRECLRVLRPGGDVRLILPNCQYLPLGILNLFYDINKFWHWYMNLPWKRERSVHFTLYTKHLAVQVAEDVGFQVTKAKGLLYSKEITLLLRKPLPGEGPTTRAQTWKR